MSADRPVSGRARYPISCTGSRPGRLGNSTRVPANAGPSPINVVRITMSSTRRIVALFDRPGRRNLNIPQSAGVGLRLLGQTLPLDLGPANGRHRRISPNVVALVISGEGLFGRPIAGAQQEQRELIFIPTIAKPSCAGLSTMLQSSNGPSCRRHANA